MGVRGVLIKSTVRVADAANHPLTRAGVFHAYTLQRFVLSPRQRRHVSNECASEGYHALA